VIIGQLHTSGKSYCSDNRTVAYVRQELLQLGHKLIDRFAVQLSDAINTILGDLENGNETKD
jgi:hypothetical protein